MGLSPHPLTQHTKLNMSVKLIAASAHARLYYTSLSALSIEPIRVGFENLKDDPFGAIA